MVYQVPASDRLSGRSALVSVGSNLSTFTVWSLPPRFTSKFRSTLSTAGSDRLTAVKVLQISLMSASHWVIALSTPLCTLTKVMPTVMSSAVLASFQSKLARPPTFLTPSTSSVQSIWTWPWLAAPAVSSLAQVAVSATPFAVSGTRGLEGLERGIGLRSEDAVHLELRGRGRRRSC